MATPRRAAAVRVRAIRSTSAMSTDAPESSRPKSSSSSVHQPLSDTLTAPIDVMAAKEMIHSGRFRMAMATRSPRWTPYRPTSAAPRAATSSATSAKVRRSSS